MAADGKAGRGEAHRPEAIRPVALFDVGGRRCALPTAAISEVLLMPELAHPPGMPAFLAGVMNLGGTAVPVIRLDRLFGLPEVEPGLYTPIMLLRGVTPTVGLLVDRMFGVSTVEVENAEDAPETEGAFAECVAGLIGEGEEATYLLDVGRVLAVEERGRLAAFQVRAQERLAEWERGVER